MFEYDLKNGRRVKKCSQEYYEQQNSEAQNRYLVNSLCKCLSPNIDIFEHLNFIGSVKEFFNNVLLDELKKYRQHESIFYLSAIMLIHCCEKNHTTRQQLTQFFRINYHNKSVSNSFTILERSEMLMKGNKGLITVTSKGRKYYKMFQKIYATNLLKANNVI